MKKCVILMQLIFLFLMLSTYAFSAPNVPTNVTVSSTTQNTIKVTWTGDSDADGFYVYYGTSAGDLDQKVSAGNVRQYTITGLNAGTEYFVAVSAFDNNTGESNKSETKPITTMDDTVKPATPSGFSITSTDDIKATSASFKWNKNSETDLANYKIYYGTTSGSLTFFVDDIDKNATSIAVTGLISSTRYYFAIAAVDISDNESDKSEELIVDLLPDDLPPFVPVCSGELSGLNEITVRISDENSHMVDYDGCIIFYGTSPGVNKQSIDIGKNMSHVFDNLAEGSTWYFSALAYDIHDNESTKSTEISVKVEETNSFLGQGDKFDGGCFIQTTTSHLDASNWLWLPLLIFTIIIYWALPNRIKTVFCVALLLFITGTNAIAEESAIIKNNMMGVSVGYFMPSESDFKDYYDESVFPVFGFYERRIYKFLSADIEAGYLKEDGNLMTVSGAQTQIGSDLTMVPVSASLKVNKEIAPYIVGYIGIGPDYWYCKEKIDVQTADGDTKEWVGGYHGKLGFKLCNMDEQFKNTGAIIECVYSQIDRFGDNDLDIGGLTVKLGFFYQY